MNESTHELPAGYIDFCGLVAIHLAELRKHTTDIHRFQKYVGLALELEPTENGTEEWLSVVEKADDIEALMLTCREIYEALLEVSSLLEESL